jgi:hypothetical protein
MYIADLEYHTYEAKLTRDLQEEGLAATLVSLGLTSTASLITVASTTRILAGAATVVTGSDKAFSDKVLLSNTIQALQAQMRADRKQQAAIILAAMLRTGHPTPIDEYPLAMALSDVDHYYQAGTVASALVGLQRTVANAEQSADLAKLREAPNPPQALDAKVTAVPILANTAGTSSALPAPRPVIVLQAATDTGVAQLRALLRPNGKNDDVLRTYVQSLVGGDKVQIGPILIDRKFANLRLEIIACIKSRTAGQPCPANVFANEAK